VPQNLFTAKPGSSQNLQALLSLHKTITQQLSGFADNPQFEGDTAYDTINPSRNVQNLLISDTASDKAPSTPTEYPNNEKTFPLFKFRNYGGKSIKRASGKRKYYKCTEKTCPAKYTLTEIDPSGSPTQVHTFSPDSHNHLPPPDPHINPEVKEQSLACLRAGASPANIHKQRVRESSLPLSPADVPTLGMLRKWKHRDAYKDMESSMHRALLYICIFPSNNNF
jgi:hypothetical protein